MKSQYVYIFKCGNYLKIGTSNDYQQRYRSLQGANPIRIQIVLIMQFEDKLKGYEIENYLHNKFHHKRTLAEWFDYDASIVTFVKSKYKENIIKHSVPDCFSTVKSKSVRAMKGQKIKPIAKPKRKAINFKHWVFLMLLFDLILIMAIAYKITK